MRRPLFSKLPALFFILSFGIFSLNGCASLPMTSIPESIPVLTSVPPGTMQPTSLPPAASATPLPSTTPAPTLTSTLLPTSTASIPPHYVFPLQPPEAGGFAEGTAAHGYPATDIFALMGTKFVAVTTGTVDFVSTEDTWDPAKDDPAVRGGLAVAIIGRDGVRYYGSHLSAVAAGLKPGVEVEAGQLLGLVGNSGNARNTTSHLHFGISRPTTPDDWKARRGQVDPFPFLQAWKDGHDVTPPLPVP